MTQGIDEAGDLRLGVDSRERYDTRSKRNRADERTGRETKIFRGLHVVGASTEIFELGNADELRRFALDQVDGYSANVRLSAQLRTADGARQATVNRLFHVQNLAGTVVVTPGTKEQLGDADLSAVLVSVTDVVQVQIDDVNVTELAFDAVVQLEILQQYG